MTRRLLSRNHYFPPARGDEWETTSPAALGWDRSKLDEAIAFIRDRDSTALVILHKGKIAVEEYWQGWGKDTSSSIFSAGKSIISTAIGMAQEQGKLRIQDPMSKYLGKNWTKAPPEKEALITIRDVLTMTSGLDEELKYEKEPGLRWFYNTPAFWELAHVIEKAAGKGIADYLNEFLWSQIGARNTSWNGKQTVGSARDMARFGLMIMNNGAWQGKDIVKDKAYLFDATNKSQELNQSYGYLWWLNDGNSYRRPGPGELQEGALIPSAPPDTFAALGMGDKKIYIVPGLEMVVMRHGGPAAPATEPTATRFDTLLWERLMPAIMPK